MNYQLLIKNGTVVDPAQGIHARKDVAFANGRVSAISDEIPTSDAREVLDAAGMFRHPRSNRLARACLLRRKPLRD